MILLEKGYFDRALKNRFKSYPVKSFFNPKLFLRIVSNISSTFLTKAEIFCFSKPPVISSVHSLLLFICNITSEQAGSIWNEVLAQMSILDSNQYFTRLI